VSRSLTYEQAIDTVRILDVLADFDPRIAGTLPIGLAVGGSDIDVICYANDARRFAETIWLHFCDLDSFCLYQWTSNNHPIIARFLYAGWPFEIFGGSRPVDEQTGWRHFAIEKRLLDLDDGRLRSAVMALRAKGQKTEPAFTAALAIEGNPYRALLDLETEHDETLRSRLMGINTTRD
jgi:hypothetical protein